MCYAPAIYGGPPKRAGAISGRIGTSYPQRAAGCCDAARAGGQMLRCGKDIGQMFSELISLCMQLIAFSVLTITPTSYLVLVQGPNNLVLSIKERTHGKAIKHNR